MGLANHERRFRQWLSEHTGLLLKVVRSFADDPAEQDDLFQEIVLQVWLSLPNCHDDSKPTTWLYRVAFNTALAWKRAETKHRRKMNALSIADVAVTRDAAAEVEQNNALLDRLYAASRALPPAKRALVVLFLDGFSYREIAEVVGISEANVGVSLNRIKKVLATSVKEGGDEFPG